MYEMQALNNETDVLNQLMKQPYILMAFPFNISHFCSYSPVHSGLVKAVQKVFFCQVVSEAPLFSLEQTAELHFRKIEKSLDQMIKESG